MFLRNQITQLTLSCLHHHTAPSGKRVPLDIFPTPDSKLKAEFTPHEVGPHRIDIRYEDVPIAGAPFICNAYDPARVSVGPVPNGVPGKPVVFDIDTTLAGEGDLEVVVKSALRGGTSTSLPVTIQRKKGDRGAGSGSTAGVYEASFVPHDAAQHFIDVKFNGHIVPGKQQQHLFFLLTILIDISSL